MLDAGASIASMARLNEASVPVVGGESLEALKRRFMRQNRELAKSNSELKIKVATLEADRAQLLSENITLRDQNNHLKQEQGRDYTKQAIKNVGAVKDKLVAKVAELTDLMAELEVAQAKPPKATPAPNTARRRSYKKSPTHVKNWKSSLYGPEVTGLAPIVEGELFPRRLSGYVRACEVREGADESSTQEGLEMLTDSSELGSPPVAHFETTEPFIYGASPPEPAEEVEEQTSKVEKQESTADLFANLETRRKRRTSGLIRESTDEPNSTTDEKEPAKVPETAPLLKAGAKRKLALRDEEHEAPRSAVPENTSFSFSRKSGAAVEKPVNRQMKPLPERNLNKVAERAKTIVGDVKARKALSENPVVSPVKVRLANEKQVRPELLEKVKERQKQRQQAKVEAKAEKFAIEIPPATPAPVEADFFSPSESLPSANPGTRDTPPPSELTSKNAENTRPLRRQRAQVSYAEPSLRDKMRRPGKELADAVITGKTTKEESQVAVKQEDTTIPNWGTLPVESRKGVTEPTSPLQSKSSNTEEPLPSSVATDRRRKSSARTSDMSTLDLKSEVARTAIAAMISSQRRLSRVQDAETQKPVENSGSEIFDSSSPESFGQKASKQSRRHSSMSDVRSKKEAVSRSRTVDSKVDGEDEISATRAERTASRRRSMQI